MRVRPSEYSPRRRDWRLLVSALPLSEVQGTAPVGSRATEDRVSKSERGDGPMKLHEHRFRYRDTEDLIRQLDALLTKLLERPKLTDYATMRARYPHLNPSAFTMRLRRFERAGGFFPRQMGDRSRKIAALFVTPALDAHLRK